MRIYLTGFMGAAKSTVGRLLAAGMGYEFLDLDRLIERRTGVNITTIFEEQGETAFRNLEAKELRMVTSDPAVIATGGGCFIHNTEWMLQNGTVIYLQVPFDALAARIGAD